MFGSRRSRETNPISKLVRQGWTKRAPTNFGEIRPRESKPRSKYVRVQKVKGNKSYWCREVERKEPNKVCTPSIPKYSGLFQTIVALNQTRPSNRKAQFWISAIQIANFEVTINPRNMYFKIMYIFFWFWGYFSFFGNVRFRKSPLYFGMDGVVFNVEISFSFIFSCF